MSPRKDRGVQKIITTVLVLLLVQLACSGTNPTDPRIPEALNSMVSQFDPLLVGLQVIPLGGLRPPLITQITSDSVSGLGSIGGTGSGIVDATGVESSELSFKIRLYSMELHGCGQEPTRGPLLAETTVDFGGTWNINHKFETGEVVGATQVSEGNESGLSNLKVNIVQSQFLTLDNANEFQQTEYEISQPLILTGKSFRGACVVLQNQNMTDPRTSTTADEDGNWKITISVQEGENKYRVFVEDWEDVRYELSIRGIFPRMQWPYEDSDGNPDYAIAVSGFFGYNDYYWVELKHRFHDGIDIAGTSDDFPRAVAEGDVFYVQIGTKDWDGGNVVIIDHGAWYSVYMHLYKIVVDCSKPITTDSINDCSNPRTSKYYDNPIHVNAGDIIGVTGKTGCPGCGVHLHFSAFRWIKGNRQESLGENHALTWPWIGNYGERLNVNPPRNKTLLIQAYPYPGGNISPEHKVDSTERVQNCVSDFDYWALNWEQVPIKEYGPPDTYDDAVGTQFDFKGMDEKCAIP